MRCHRQRVGCLGRAERQSRWSAARFCTRMCLRCTYRVPRVDLDGSASPGKRLPVTRLGVTGFRERAEAAEPVMHAARGDME